MTTLSPCTMSVPVKAALVAILLTLCLLGASCGSGGGAVDPSESALTEPAADSLAQLVGDLDELLRESIRGIGLDPEGGRREVRDNSCVGPGGSGKNVRFYFDEPSHDRGVEYLHALEEAWSRGEFELNGPEPFQDDGSLASLLAISGDFGLEGWWFPASRELAIGGSTSCVE